MVKESITPPISEKYKIDTVNKTDKSQASNKKVDTSSSNKSDKGKSLDKSRSTKITETEHTVKTVDKSNSISSASLSEGVTKYKNYQKYILEKTIQIFLFCLEMEKVYQV